MIFQFDWKQVLLLKAHKGKQNLAAYCLPDYPRMGLRLTAWRRSIAFLKIDLSSFVCLVSLGKTAGLIFTHGLLGLVCCLITSGWVCD